jgi:thiamine-monophosphate kinase
VTKTLKNIGETGIIELIREKTSKRLPPFVRKGIGDDCAVLEASKDSLLLVTTDTLVEGVHFTPQTLSPEDIGWKALAVNISDVAAMGGMPSTAFLSMGISRATGVNFIESFLDGFNVLAEKTGVVLAGGDTVESPSSIVITITLLGNCPKDSVVYRSGAKVGDDIWVTGPLGNSAAGLFLLSDKSILDYSGYESLIEAHKRPMPRLDMGKALGGSHLAHAMIDVSDGIAKDLSHICQESDTGALLHPSSVPMAKEMQQLAAQAGKDPMDWALHGGEDFELLFTASAQDRKEVEALTEATLGIPAARIGTITEGDRVKIQTSTGPENLSSGGYHHFAKYPS